MNTKTNLLSRNELKHVIGGNTELKYDDGEDNCKDASCGSTWWCSGTNTDSGHTDCYKAYDHCGGFIRCGQ